MCLGGHLAYRAALDPRVAATICYFATDIHSHSLGEGLNDDSLKRAGDIKGELILVCTSKFEIKNIGNDTDVAAQIFGKKDTHVPPAGRDLIRKTLHEAGVTFSFYEPAHAQRMFGCDTLTCSPC
jgi:carboxymethylenebutenolidase